MGLLLAVWAHHQEVADPAVLDKIKHAIDEILGLSAGTLVVLFGLALIFIPTFIFVSYYFYRRGTAVSFEDDDREPGSES